MLIGRDSSTIHSEALMAEIARGSLPRMLLVSLGLHVLLVVVASLPFITLCVRYGSMDPRPIYEAAIEQLKKQEAGTGQEAGAVPASAKASQAETTPSAAAPEVEVESAAPTSGLSKVEKAITEVSGDRPEHSALSFDDVDSLE